MNLIVETTGSFMLIHPETRQEISHSRPTVVLNDGFVQMRLSNGDLRLLASDVEGTDEDFASYWKENPSIAVAAFTSAVPDQFDLLEEVLNQLGEEDFQADGKPKVAPLNALVDFKVTRDIRDAFWEARE